MFKCKFKRNFVPIQNPNHEIGVPNISNKKINTRKGNRNTHGRESRIQLLPHIVESYEKQIKSPKKTLAKIIYERWNPRIVKLNIWVIEEKGV